MAKHAFFSLSSDTIRDTDDLLTIRRQYEHSVKNKKQQPKELVLCVVSQVSDPAQPFSFFGIVSEAPVAILMVGSAFALQYDSIWLAYHTNMMCHPSEMLAQTLLVDFPWSY